MATDYTLLPTIATIVIAVTAVIALGVTIAHFRAGEKRAEKQFRAGEERAKKHEQVRISREIWNEILKQNRFIHEWPITEASERIKLKRYMDSLRNDLDYFVFLVEKGEITEPHILQYYRKKVTDIEANVNEIYKNYPAYIDVKGFKETKEILCLIEKYNELTDKVKEDKESDRIEEDKESNSSKN